MVGREGPPVTRRRRDVGPEGAFGLGGAASKSNGRKRRSYSPVCFGRLPAAILATSKSAGRAQAGGPYALSKRAPGPRHEWRSPGTLRREVLRAPRRREVKGSYL